MSTTPSFLDTLKREAGAFGEAVNPMSALSGLYHAAADPPRADENAEFTNKIGPTGRLIDRTIVQPTVNAVKDYSSGKVSYDDVLHYAPEALGGGAGTLALGKALAGEHPQVASEALREHASTGGSTVDPLTGRNLAGSRKIAVGVAPEHSVISDRPISQPQYSEFVATHRDVLSKHPNVAVGTHYDPTTGLHHLELVGTTTSKSAASNLAAHLGEDHAYNLATDEKVPSGVSPQAERPVSHLTLSERLAELNAQSPTKAPYSGTHFSDAQLDMIDGGRRGAVAVKGPTSSEAARLRLGTQTGHGPDAPGGFYSYKAGALPDAAMASKKNAYQVRGQYAFGTTDSPEFQNGYAQGVQKAAAAGADAQTAHQLGLNSAEHALQDAGYDGYHSLAHPNIRFHFGSEVATPSGPRVAPDLAEVADPSLADVESTRQGRAREMEQKYPVKPAGKSSTSIPDWPENYKNPPKDGGGANYSAADLQVFKAKHGITNGSGESAASMEAINRVASEKTNGVRRYRIDSRSGTEIPLFGTESVDAKAGPYDVIMQRTPHGDIELDRGIHARRLK